MPMRKYPENPNEVCLRCGKVYHRSANASDRYCRVCQQEYQRAWRYGVTVDQLRAFIATNNGTCDICGELIIHGKQGKNGAYIDHDHKSGKLRGILCHHCNSGLGMFNDDPIRLSSALSYLTKNIEKA